MYLCYMLHCPELSLEFSSHGPVTAGTGVKLGGLFYSIRLYLFMYIFFIGVNDDCNIPFIMRVENSKGCQ